MLPALLSPADGLDASALDDAAPAAAPVAADPLLRKSVTYHPVPLSWKPAAVNCLRKVSAPHAGQVVNGASETFCNTSLAWPQDSHLYA